MIALLLAGGAHGIESLTLIGWTSVHLRTFEEPDLDLRATLGPDVEAGVLRLVRARRTR